MGDALASEHSVVLGGERPEEEERGSVGDAVAAVGVADHRTVTCRQRRPCCLDQGSQVSSAESSPVSHHGQT